ATPVVVAILSRVLLGEQLRPSILTALACAITGVVLLVGVQPLTGVGPSAWAGIGLALLTALGYGLFQVCGRVLAKRYHPMQTLSIFVLVAALALLPITLTTGFVTRYPPVGWLLLVYLRLPVSVLS